MNPNIKDTVILIAEVLVPDLYEKETLQYAFLKNFKKLYYGIEPKSLAKIKVLLKLIDKMAFLYDFKVFRNMSYTNRQKYIERLFRFPVGKIRGGMTGLRSLILIAFYNIESVWEDIGYNGPVNAHLK